MTTTTTNLQEVFQAEVLPALPHSAITLLQMSQNPEAGPAEFTKPIEADPGLVGQVLKFVNSSHFGFQSEITSVQQALTLVGKRAITNFALWNAVFSVIPNPQFGPFDLKSLWQDSLRRAVFARKIGKSLGLSNSEDLFAGALLQDMAIPLLLKQLPSEYETLVRRRADEGRRLSELEQETFGWDHAAAAALLAKQWSLPNEIAILIANHTDLNGLLVSGEQDLGAACVALTSLLPSCSDEGWSESFAFLEGYAALSGHSPFQLAELFAEVDESTESFAPLMRIGTPQVALVDYLSKPNQ